MAVRRETWPMLVQDSKGRSSKITEAQLECPHPRGQRRRGGNRYGRYEHCGKCGLRLKFVKAADLAAAATAAATSSASGLTQAQRLDVPNAKSKAKAKAQAATATASPAATSEVGSSDLAAALLRMADSQRVQSDTLSQGMQAMLQQQSALMQQQNQITGTMLQSLDRLQHTMMVLATPSTEQPPSDPPIKTEPPSEPPSAASHTAAALIPVVDLTLDDEMGDWTAPAQSVAWDLTGTEEDY